MYSLCCAGGQTQVLVYTKPLYQLIYTPALGLFLGAVSSPKPR